MITVVAATIRMEIYHESGNPHELLLGVVLNRGALVS